MDKKEEKLTFKTLATIDVSTKVEEKNGLTYLPWSQAWGIIKQRDSTATYNVTEYEGKPYLYDEHLGYMVSTTVTVCGETLGMHLPVMDGSHKAMKAQPYKYTTRYGEKAVAGASMFDINKAIMRCLVKNLALFGLGLGLYTGDDIIDEGETPRASVNGSSKLKTSAPSPQPTKANKPVKRELIDLSKDDNNWKKVMTYIANNKDQSLTQVAKTLGLKYRISAAVKKELGVELKKLKESKDDK